MNEWTIPKKKDAVGAERDAALARVETLREALRIVQEEIIVRTPGLARLWLTVTEAALSTPAAPVLAEQEEKAAQLTRCLARSKTVHVADPAPCNCRVYCPAHDPGAEYAISPNLARQTAALVLAEAALEHCRQRPHEHNPGPDFAVTRCDVIDRGLAAVHDELEAWEREIRHAALSTPAAPVLAEQEEKAAHDPGAKYAISPTLARQALEALQEMVDLMEDIRTGDYEPDTFTAQPARAAIAALEAALKEEP